MNPQTHRFARTLGLALALLTAAGSWAEEPDQIVFLQLKLKDGALTLVRSSVKPGRLKTPIASDKKGQLQLALTSTNGTVLWSEVMADPTVQRLEYEDPEHPGTLKVKEVKVTQAEFTVRVPFHKEARQLTVHRLDPPASRAEASAPGTARQLLGTVTLPTKEGQP